MTFEEFFSANYRDPAVDKKTQKVLREIARSAQAACWNAAIDAAAHWIAGPDKTTEQSELMRNALIVTPIDGVMQKLSQ
jgi:hypothetical protein